MEVTVPEASFTKKLRQTWLTRRPNPNAEMIAVATSLLLLLSSFLYWANIFNAQSWMPASREQIFDQHQYWQAWTALFAHADIAHLLSNVLLFYFFGSFLAGYFGALSFPLATFFFGGVTNILVVASMPPSTQLLGVSGVVYWLGGAWLVLYALLERRLSVYKRTIRAMGVGIILFIPTEAFDPTISYRSHAIGFAFGLAWGVGYFLWKKRELRAAEDFELVWEEPASTETDIASKGHSEILP